MIASQLGALVIKGSSVVFHLVVSVTLARRIGSSDLGLLNLCLTVLGIIATFCFCGTNIYIARYVAQGNAPEAKRTETLNSLVISASLSVLAIISLYAFLGERLETVYATERLAATLSLLAITLIPGSVRGIFSQAIRGYGRPLLANVYLDLLPNLLKLVGLFLVLLLNGAISLREYGYVLVTTAAVSALAPVFWLLRDRKLTPLPALRLDGLLGTTRGASTFLWISSTFIVANGVDSLMLGFYKDMSRVAYYGAALSISGLFTLVLDVSNSVTSPRAARVCELRDPEQISGLFRESRRFMVLIATLPALLVCTFSAELLEIWGKEFASASSALIILCLARYLQLFFGNAGQLLTMLHRERIVRNCLLGSVVANITLNALLIPRFGLSGAAGATGATLLANRVLLLVFLRRSMKFGTDS